ncbi:hypothetical protein [Luteibacter sp. UNCMF366Tsu5.1]|uniref:hypothetical protein n=1 Tax=Luteibacter sp. UNCMF366Tsu5.1 TaxID=1502758 RepID=UPI0011607007|nr:hypothetical protein [Luteibacter sp. UNCMF366Tsu5.1]
MSGIPLPSSASLSAEASAHLARVRECRAVMDQAARDTATAADELRRYAKFARPGQPSTHVVQMRQRQASARRDSAQAKQAFLQASAAFVHAAGLRLPPRTSLEAFVLAWIERDVGNTQT